MKQNPKIIDSKNKMYRDTDTNAVINNDIRAFQKFKNRKKHTIEDLIKRIERLEKLLEVENS